MPAVVIADVFSGRPNPQWTIDGELLVQFQSMLDQLPHAHGSMPPQPPGLGYRGLLVQFPADQDIGTGELRLFGGYVLRSHDASVDTWIDAGRTLERWLIGTGLRSPHAAVLRDILKRLGSQ
jgi:hypothetical protein